MWEETHPAPVRGTNDGRDFAVTTERRGVLGGFLRGGETVSGRGRCPEAPGNPAAGRRVCGRRFRARRASCRQLPLALLFTPLALTGHTSVCASRYVFRQKPQNPASAFPAGDARAGTSAAAL